MGGGEYSTTWSGTNYSIYKALQNYYDVVSHPIVFSKVEKNVGLLRKVIQKLFPRFSDFSIYSNKKSQGKLNRMEFSEEEKAILLFGELNSRYVRKCFVYQDLTVNYLADLYNSDSKLLQYTPLSANTSSKVVDKRLSMVNQFYANCNGLFTMSHWLCDYMKNSGVISPEKVHFVGAGCNIDITKVDNSKKKGNKFLFVGKDFERKNGKLVVKAFELLHKNHPDTELYIVGPKTQSECGELGDGIVFLGRKTFNELIEYYNLCDYFVMPSLFEAYGIVFGEALIFGLPCIGNHCYAMPEFITEGENGFLIYHNDPCELADRMEDLLANRNIAENVMGDREEYIKKYSWDSVAQRMYDIIESQNNTNIHES